MVWAPCRARCAPAAWAHTSLLWAPENPLKTLTIESTLICINYADQVAVAHCCGLGGSHAVLATSRWTDTGFIHYNKWFCSGVFGKQLVVVIGCR